jgi:transmembrane sensor
VVDDLAPGIEAVRDELTPAWDDARGDRLLERIGRSQRRRRIMLLGGYAALGAASLFALGAGGSLLLAAGNDRSEWSSAAQLRITASQSVRLADAAVRVPAVAAEQSSDWRSLYQSGEYEVAAQRLLEAGSEVGDDPAALMDAADLARLSDHPEAAVGYLSRVLRGHARSPVAPFAGFMLGRVLLERLGQPAEAAEAFALARRIAPHGSLAQDALGREVEAWSKAGHSNEAYDRARLYVRLYPSGRRLRAVQLYGGLE